MPDRRETVDEDWDVRELVLRAAERTTPPGHFDVAPAMLGGRRRRAVRRRATVAVCVAAAVAVVLAVLPQLGTKTASGPIPSRDGTATPTSPAPDPSASATSATPELTAQTPGLIARQRLDRVLADPGSVISDLHIEDPLNASAVVRRCDSNGGCDSVLVVTSDAWRHMRAVLFQGAMSPWMRWLPDGSVAFTPEDQLNAPLGLLLPDGSLVPMTRTTATVSTGTAGLLTTGPSMYDFEASSTGLWVVDPTRHTLSPVENLPPGTPGLPEPVMTSDGATAVVLFESPSPPTLRVARTADGGRTWTSTSVTARSGHNIGSATVAVGPRGRMALGFVADGATVMPLVDLWTSRDDGRSWIRDTSRHRPLYVDGMAYLRDGRLVLADERGRIWRQTTVGGDFQLTAQGEHGSTVGSTGDGDVFRRTGLRSFAVSADGSHWTETVLSTDPAAYTMVGSYDPLPTPTP